MKLKLTVDTKSPLEKQIMEEEKRFEVALKNDAEFQVLKEIKTNINALKAELSEARRHTKRGNYD